MWGGVGVGWFRRRQGGGGGGGKEVEERGGQGRETQIGQNNILVGRFA